MKTMLLLARGVGFMPGELADAGGDGDGDLAACDEHGRVMRAVGGL